MARSSTGTIAQDQRRRWIRAVAGLTAASALALGSVAIASASSTHTGAQLQSMKVGAYGAALVNSSQHTLYLLTGETATSIACSTTCLTTWPPLVVSSATKSVSLGAGVKGHIGFVKRSATTKQVTFNGHPLYRYSGDHSIGQHNGEGFGGPKGAWEMVHAGATTASTTPYAPLASIKSVNTTSFTNILATSSGYVLYTLSSESTGTIHCTGICLSAWPPLLVPKSLAVFTVGAGVDGKIGFVSRSSTQKQVTFNGFPIYRYSGDSAPGQSFGQGIAADGGIWYVTNAQATSSATTQRTHVVAIAHVSTTLDERPHEMSNLGGGW